MYETYEKHKEEIERASRKWRRKYHHEGHLLIGCVGRITSKDAFDLLKAFKRLSKEMKNVYLYFSDLYSGDVLYFVEKESGNLFGERVFYFKKDTLPKPYDDDYEIKIAKIYKTFDLIVYPSRHESSGLVPLVALSCGTPMLVKDVDNLSTFVKEGLCEGFSSEDELYRKMKEMLLNISEYKERAENNRKVLLEKYSSEDTRKCKGIAAADEQLVNFPAKWTPLAQ